MSCGTSAADATGPRRPLERRGPATHPLTRRGRLVRASSFALLDDADRLEELLALGDVDPRDPRQGEDVRRRTGRGKRVLLAAHVRHVAEVAERARADPAERVDAEVEVAGHQLVAEGALAPVRAGRAAAARVLDLDEAQPADLLVLLVRGLADEARIDADRADAERALEVPE